MTRLCFYGGLDTIGGNIAEIRRGNDRVIFDFGRAYNPADVLLASAAGRENSVVADLLKLKILPPIDGIYRLSVTPRTSGGNIGVFISHLHLDHMASIDCLAPEVPVYMSRESKELYSVLDEPPAVPLERIHGLSYGEPVSIGEIKVTLFAVDHDCHGASAIYAETPDMRIAYSGDIRMHGMCPEKNHTWIKAMREAGLDYLLMEGTSFFPSLPPDEPPGVFPRYSEKEVSGLVAEKLLSCSGLAFFNYYHRNLDRMGNLIKAAETAGRKIVFEKDTARLAGRFLPQADILVLDESINISEINANPGGYFVQNSFGNIMSLIDYETEGSVYIHTNGIPLGAYDPAFNSMQSLLAVLGAEYWPISVSGHADREAILNIIDGISPKVLIPWHSKAPQEVIPLNPAQKVLLPEKNTWY